MSVWVERVAPPGLVSNHDRTAAVCRHLARLLERGQHSRRRHRENVRVLRLAITEARSTLAVGFL